MAGLPVELVERDLLGFRGGRVQRDGTGDERKAQESFPIRAGRHDRYSNEGTVRTQDELGTLVPTPEIPTTGSFFGLRPYTDSTPLFLLCSIRGMTDRPASWRMPSPKQMEKLAAAAAARGNVPPVQTPGPGDEMPPEYWQAVLDDPHADASRRTGPSIRTQRLSDIQAAPAAGRLPPLRADRRDPKGRCRSAGRAPGRLERRRPAAAG